MWISLKRGTGDPVENLKKINGELEQYSPDLIKKPQVVVGTKLDIAGNGERLASLETYCAQKNTTFYTGFSSYGNGIKHLAVISVNNSGEIRDSR